MAQASTKTPKPLRSCASHYALRKFVKKHRDDLKRYFEAIPQVRVFLRGVGIGLTDDDRAQVAAALAVALNECEPLFEWIDHNEQDIDDAAMWSRICLALAHIIVELFDEQPNGGAI